MNSIIEQMLTQHETATLFDKKNGIKEVVQEIVLCGLSRAGFFKRAAFYGGTALRIFYGLDRFSEDLDFSLMSPDLGFDLPAYLPVLEKELKAYGLNFAVESREKVVDSDIRSAFLKGNTREHMLIFYADEQLARSVSGNEVIKVKFEVDTTPPPYATFERKYRLMPLPYEVNLYDMPSLFSGKLHAVICRAWRSRVKGRDLYDYVFYFSRNTPFNLKHLNARLVDSNFEGAREDLSLDDIKGILCRRFESIDFNQAKEDVLPFIRTPEALDIWSPGFFAAITEGLTAV